MKFMNTCFECPDHPTDVHHRELVDDGTYQVKCRNGHLSTVVMRAQKFEVLFETGVAALEDGYPREAMSSFAASLERFYQFYSTTIAIKHNVDIEAFLSNWKFVENQSERQLGAYVFCYMIEHPDKIVPTIDDEKPTLEGVSKGNTKTWKSFRNAVIHKGYMPTKSEVWAYTEITYKHIIELIKDLKDNSEEAMRKADWLPFRHIEEKYKGEQVMIRDEPGPLSVTQGQDYNPASLEAAVKRIKSKFTHSPYEVVVQSAPRV